MEEIKIKYTKDVDISNDLEKIIENYIKNNEYSHKIIFVSDEDKNIKNYQELESYKLLDKNIKNLVNVIKKEKKTIEDIVNEINKRKKLISDN